MHQTDYFDDGLDEGDEGTDDSAKGSDGRYVSIATSPKDEQDDSDEETEGNGTLVPLSEATKAFLKTAFSSEMMNSDRTKGWRSLESQSVTS